MSKNQRNTNKNKSGNCGKCGKVTERQTTLMINLVTTLENEECVRNALKDNAFVASIAKLCSSECPDKLIINLAVVSLGNINDK